MAMKIIGVKEGSLCFMIEASCLSSLRQLWRSYLDGTLKENLQEVINAIPEVKKLSDGKEIDIEVELDEKEYHKAFWELAVSQVKGVYNK